VLDAAEEVILREGIASFTLDAVAAEAGVSKGGLLHHYPSKDKLIATLVSRTIDQWSRDTQEAIDAEPPAPGRVARALMQMCLASPAKWSEQSRRSSAVLVAAIANDRALVRPMRENHRRMLEQLRDDGLPPGASEAVVLAIHGLWFEWLFGLEDMNPHRLATLHDTLERVLHPPSSSTRTVKSARVSNASLAPDPMRRDERSHP